MSHRMVMSLRAIIRVSDADSQALLWNLVEFGQRSKCKSLSEAEP